MCLLNHSCADTGYAKSFADAGPFIDDADPRRRPALLAIDATRYERGREQLQFEAAQMERELNKALAGFSTPGAWEDEVAVEVDEAVDPKALRPRRRAAARRLFLLFLLRGAVAGRFFFSFFLRARLCAFGG